MGLFQVGPPPPVRQTVVLQLDSTALPSVLCLLLVVGPLPVSAPGCLLLRLLGACCGYCPAHLDCVDVSIENLRKHANDDVQAPFNVTYLRGSLEHH